MTFHFKMAATEALEKEKCGKKMGYETLKEQQKEAILSFLQKRDVFVTLPTGFGKSHHMTHVTSQLHFGTDRY